MTQTEALKRLPNLLTIVRGLELTDGFEFTRRLDEKYALVMGLPWDEYEEAVKALIRSKEIADLLTELPREYETEYDGRTYCCCTACDANLSDDRPHSDDCTWIKVDSLLAKKGGE